MLHIQVFGANCKGCQKTAQLVTEIAAKLNIDFELEKVSSLEKIMQANVMGTPAIAIAGKVVHQGSVPSAELVEKLLVNA